MMTNNKILTVSYGTFSCTLEGFEDSFGTMKAIAEYFRDLAADDRYFGAEPPQPDAEMLARIAEREISRRVAAREQEGRIVLSAAPAAAVETAPAPAPQSDTQTADALPDAAPTEAPAPQETQTVSVPDAPEAQEAIAEPSPVVAPTEESPAQDSAEPVATVEENALTDDTDDTAQDTPDDISADASAPEDGPEPEVIAEDMTSDDDSAEPEAAPAPDSIAAKLQRIRAVVSQSKEAGLDEDMFEDEHADPIGLGGTTDTAAEDAVAEAVTDAEDAIGQDDLGPDEDADDAEAILADAVAAVTAEESVAETVAEDDAEDDVSDILARIEAEAQDDADDVTPEVEAIAEPEAPVVAEAQTEAGEDGPEDAAEDNLFDDDDAEAEVAEAPAPIAPATPAPPRRARIIKVKRADIDAALAKGEIEEITEDDAAPAPAPAAPTPAHADSSLTDEEEAELQAELAAVAAELETVEIGASDDDDVDDAPAAVEITADAPHQKVADSDVSRLMAEADTQMEEPEGSRRRNAFQHLKAAVMAKKVDAGLGKDTVKEEGAFRSDLASVVVPRRPSSDAAQADARAAERPAPLKLVAEQRVDLDEVAPSGPVRPRRVAQTGADEAQASTTAGSFAEYAEEMGAHALPDLLEAAASYLSFVEGHDQFSRPQLMTKVRQVEKEDFSREDGLRSFGQLLRAGKIAKRKGGRFAVTNDIGYRPEERAAG